MICPRSVSALLRAISPVCAALAAVTVAPLASWADAAHPGSLDSDFNPFVQKVSVYAVAVDSQGRIPVGGDDQTFSRFVSSGKGDSGFSFSDFGNNDRIVYGIAIDSIDRVYAVGGFHPGDDSGNSVNIARFFSDGSRINRGFDAGTGANNAIVAVLLQPVSSNPDEDRVIIGGLFDQYRDEGRGHIARINAAGTIDRSFDGGLDFDDDVFALALQKDPATGAPNGQIVVGGKFGKVNGNSHHKLARVNFDGHVDGSFDPDIDDDVLAVDVQADGKIVIGGQFASVNGHGARGVARLNQDGSFDDTFGAGIAENEQAPALPTAVYAIKVQADGKVVIGGNFLKVNGEKHKFLTRLNSNGSIDDTFNTDGGIVNSVNSIAFQADNKIVVGEVVSKKINGAYPNVVRRVFGDPAPPTPAVAPTVTIIGGRKAIEGGQKGYFFVNRSGTKDISNALTVHYAPKSSGVHPKAGTDYVALSGTVTIPAGEKTAKIRVKTLDSVLESDGEKLKLKLQASDDYKIGGSGQASIVFENAPLP